MSNASQSEYCLKSHVRDMMKRSIYSEKLIHTVVKSAVNSAVKWMDWPDVMHGDI